MTSAAFVSALQTLLQNRFAGDADFAAVTVQEFWTDDVVAPAVIMFKEPIKTELDWTTQGVRAENVLLTLGVFGRGDTMVEAGDSMDAIVRQIALQLRTAPPAVGDLT